MKRARFGTRFALSCALLVSLSLTAGSLVWLLGLRAIAERADEISAETIRSATMAALESHARASVRRLADRLVNAVYFYDLYEIGAELRPLAGEPNVASVLVFDAEGRVMHDATPAVARFGEPMADPLADWARAAAQPATRAGGRLLHAVAPLAIGSDAIGGVRIAYRLDALTASVDEAAELLVAAQGSEVSRRVLQIFGVLVVLLLVAFGLAYAISRSMLAPIAQLVQVAARIEDGDYEVRLPTRRNDEIGELLRSFQRMGEAVRRNTLEIRHLAYHDSLSGLPNRLLFRQTLEEKAAEARGSERDHLALLFLDLDDFKRINDTLGHDEGDRVLVTFAERVKRCLSDVVETAGEGAPWTMLARLGGDEFTVMLVGERAVECAEALGAALVRMVERPIRLGTHELHVGTSVGITVCPDDAVSAHMLLKNADVAMYGAKLSGKNRLQRFHRGLLTDARRRLGLESRLRRAVDAGALAVHYQPIVALPDGAPWGGEALARVTSPDFAAVPPSVFIPIAEEIGLIDRIGEFVLHRACDDAVGWARPDAIVTVNLSARQIRDPGLPAVVEAALAGAGLPATRLALEITESSLLATDREVIATIEALRARGVQVWLDDFGTGFSGLSHLRRLPVDGVKIDRTFISDILADPDDLALTGAIIGLARSLSMAVIAEGVESAGQLDLLTARGCRLAQGFHFGRPMEAAAFSARLARARSLEEHG